MKRQTTAGFTLVELLITLVIIGILAAVAIPSYSDHVRKGALNEAFANLADLRIRMEQFYQNNRNYGSGSCGNDGTADRVVFSIPNTKFTYTCALSGSGSAQTYVLTATGVTGTAAAGHTFTLNTSNLKETTVFKGSAVTKSCWLTTGSEC